MTNTMNYKGYAARIEYDDEDAIFTGRIAGIRDGVGFHADTVEGLREARCPSRRDLLGVRGGTTSMRGVPYDDVADARLF